jgi:ornithine--oxo-acid transaminase
LLPAFLQRLAVRTGLDRALPANGGAESVETALKAARKWGHKIKGIPADRAEIIVCSNNFHGRSITIVGFSSEPQYRDGFGPFAPGFRHVPFGDADALARAISPHTAAFLVEPIQGEGGIIVPPSGYLAQCARICRECNVLLICDEIQTGMGRTGKFLACEHENVKPDGVILGKALGGGLLPVSALVGTEELMQVFTPGDHGSTFGGNPLAAAVGLAALDVLFEEGLIERSAELGEHLLSRLSTVRSPLIREVRGKGLFVGVEVDRERIAARDIVDRLFARGILSKDTHGTVVRFAPPLTIDRETLDWAVEEVRAVFAELGDGLKRAA